MKRAKRRHLHHYEVTVTAWDTTRWPEEDKMTSRDTWWADARSKAEAVKMVKRMRRMEYTVVDTTAVERRIEKAR